MPRIAFRYIDDFTLGTRGMAKRPKRAMEQGEEAMSSQVTLIRALVASVPACMLFSGSIVLFFRGKTVCSFLQLLGAGCLVLIVLTHVCEALHLFPWMHWGLEHSVGHYLDFWSTVLGLTLFPIGYLFHMIGKRRS
jgi:hypothetical protein